jgi:hypothetical protein
LSASRKSVVWCRIVGNAPNARRVAHEERHHEHEDRERQVRRDEDVEQPRGRGTIIIATVRTTANASPTSAPCCVSSVRKRDTRRE